MTNQQKDYSPWLFDKCFQFITKDINPVKRRIVAAACRCKETGIVFVGARHYSPAMRMQIKAALGNVGLSADMDQGFIDQYDQYIDRVTAKEIAMKNGQHLQGEDWGDELYSENLY